MRESYTMKILTCLVLYQILQFKSTYRGSIVNMLQWNIINKSNSTWERNRWGRDQLPCLLPHQRMAKKMTRCKSHLENFTSLSRSKVKRIWVSRLSCEDDKKNFGARSANVWPKPVRKPDPETLRDFPGFRAANPKPCRSSDRSHSVTLEKSFCRRNFATHSFALLLKIAAWAPASRDGKARALSSSGVVVGSLTRLEGSVKDRVAS